MVRLFWLAVLAPIVGMVLIFTLISAGKLGYMPDIEELENPKNNLASEIFSADGQLMGKYFLENRSMAEFEELSPYLINALVATEDVRYYQHSGIDALALPRVAMGVATGDMSKGGGSTITQQLAKNLYKMREQPATTGGGSLGRALNLVLTKLKEWVTAVRLERNYTKDEIMAMYLNTVDFGSNAFGIKAAARTFFNTSTDSLKVQEAAMLVGLQKAVTRYNPILNYDNSLQRRNVVLSQMMKYGYLSREEFDSLKVMPIELDYSVQNHNKGISTYFREALRQMLMAKEPRRENYATWQGQQFREDSLAWSNNPLYGWCNKNFKPDGSPYNIYQDGLRIYTTIDSRMQRYAEESVEQHMSQELQPLFFSRSATNRNGPFSWRLSQQQVDGILHTSMRRSERYRVLSEAGYDSAQIRREFDKPTPMTVFDWDSPNHELDTVMSPMDSILHYKYYLRAGFMAMDPQSGHVRAYVGGIDYRHFKYDHVSVAKRQVGSTFKPFVYTLGMATQQYSPCYEIPNIPYTIQMPDPQPSYTPQYSSSRLDGGMVSLKQGLALSLNQVSAWIMKQFTPQAVIDIVRKMGVVSHIDPVPAICVGSAEVTLFEMVGAYTTFANRGIYTQPIFVTRIEDRNGNTVATFEPRRNEAISEETAYLMVELMRGVVDGGTSTRLRYMYKLTNDIAGKTGTTNDNSDGWFMGITPEIVAGAWVGGEERSIRFNSTADGQGATLALPIWGLFMQKVYADESLGFTKASFQRPAFELSVETDCGKFRQEENQHGNQNDPFFP